MRVKNVSAWACGDASKTVVSLDLDLYEKIYLLVNTNENLRSQYVLCLGELHAVFAHLRAIGTFIDGLGIPDAWIQAEWYDSECLVRQVLDCGNMKRATAAHEATVIAITTYIFVSMVKKLTTNFLLYKKLQNQLTQNTMTGLKRVRPTFNA